LVLCAVYVKVFHALPPELPVANAAVVLPVREAEPAPVDGVVTSPSNVHCTTVSARAATDPRATTAITATDFRNDFKERFMSKLLAEMETEARNRRNAEDQEQETVGRVAG